MKYSYLTVNGNSLDLEIITKGVGLKSLHFGLWKKDQPVTIDEITNAQKYYTEKLIGMFPKNTKKVLDVGAGIGDNAIFMAKKGMKVVCVSPSPSQESYFKKNILPKFKNITFVKTKYEDLEIDQKFDVVLMSESSNYFPLDKGIAKTVRYLKDGGHLIMGALMRKDNRKLFEEHHVYKTYLIRAKKHRLVLKKDIDVTKQVVQTMELTNSVFKFIPPTVNIISDFYKETFSKKHKIISWLITIFFKKELEIGKDLLLNVGPRRTDPKPFLEYVTYRFLDFEYLPNKDS